MNFVKLHPRAALWAAEIALREKTAGATKVFEFLSFHWAPVFESLFVSQLEQDGFPEMEYASIVISQLGKARCHRVVPGLVKIGSHPRISRTVVAALGEIGDRRAVDFLCSALTSQDSETAEVAARSLGAIRDRRAVGALCGQLRKGEARGEVLAAAAWALADIGDRSAAPVLKEAKIQSGVPKYDSAPLWALLNLVPEDAVPNVKATGNVYLAVYLEPQDAIPWLLDVFNLEFGKF